MPFLQKNLRTILMLLSALLAVSSAIDVYLQSGQRISFAGAMTVVLTALTGWLVKAPGTLTKAQAEVQTKKAVQAAVLPDLVESLDGIPPDDTREY